MQHLHPEYLKLDGKPVFAVLPIEEFNYVEHCLARLHRIDTGSAPGQSEADKAISLDEARDLLEKEF